MNEKFNKNDKVDKFTNMLGIAVRLIVIDPLRVVSFLLRIDTCTRIQWPMGTDFDWSLYGNFWKRYLDS